MLLTDREVSVSKGCQSPVPTVSDSTLRTAVSNDALYTQTEDLEEDHCP